VSFANKKKKGWEMLIAPPLLDLAMKPDKRPPSTKAEIILLNASITITNRKGQWISLSQATGATKEN
jgi:hypothetical protein